MMDTVKSPLGLLPPACPIIRLLRYEFLNLPTTSHDSARAADSPHQVHGTLLPKSVTICPSWILSFQDRLSKVFGDDFVVVVPT